MCLLNSDIELKTALSDLMEILDWAERWEMKLNVPKCRVMHYGNGNRNQMYVIGSVNMESSTLEKDLGVLFSDNFKKYEQCCAVAKKCNQVMGLINRTIEFKNDFVMLQLYKSLVRPHMDYCVQVWRPHLQKDIALLESIQRRYTKRIVSCKDLPYDDRLKHLGLMTVNDRMMRADLIEIYKIMHAIDDLDFNCYFDLNRSVTRGNDFKLFKKRKK